MANVHEGHRQRLRDRFLKEGLDGFAPHNVLELLLFYAVPQRDTNELAHRLLARFGSLSGVLDADFDELCQVEGVGANVATLLKLVPGSRAGTSMTMMKTEWSSPRSKRWGPSCGRSSSGATTR